MLPSASDPVGMEDWTEPGAHQVADGVYRIPLPLPTDGLRAVNVYALLGDDGLVLVDGGWAIEESRTQLEKSLAAIGHTLRDIRRFVVTHLHRDHYTQAVAVRRALGARVALGADERDSLEVVIGLHGRVEPAQLRQLERAGAAELAGRMRGAGFVLDFDEPENWQPPDDWLVGGQEIAVNAQRSLLAVHTPGHTRGHLAYAELQAGLLFTGDHVLPHITPSIGFEQVSGHLPLQDYLSSLRKVREMPDLQMLPAHGLPGPSVHARVDELLAHHASRLDLCHEAVGRGGATAHDVARVLPWTNRARTFASLDDFNQMLAVCETAAHLDLLVVAGRLAVQEFRGVRHFTR